MGLTEIAGYYKNLKKGFEELGIECTFINLSSNRFNYGYDDEPIILIRWIKWLINRKRKSKAISRLLWDIVLRFAKIPFFIWALCKYDVFIFGFNSTFFGYYSKYNVFRNSDIPILKFFKKKIIFQYHGSDSRPPFLDGTIMNESRNVSIEECIKLTKEKKEVIRKIDKYADVIIDIPPQGLFREKPYICWMYIGLPYVVEPSISNHKEVKKDKVCILHAPSNPEVKGTSEIRQIIDNLKNKGYEFEYIEIKNMPNEEVIKALQECDFVIDQIYSDYPMPGFATEAAWHGKPVVIGGYTSDYWKKWLSKEKLPPTLFFHPSKIEEVVERLIVDKDYRYEVGKNLKEFVKREWSAKKVAERYVKLIKGDIPETWWHNPQDNTCIMGCGMSEKRVKQIVRSMIEEGGIESLQLQDKPEVEQRIKNFAYKE